MSKLRLLFETDDEIEGLYLRWVLCMHGPGCSVVGVQNRPQGLQKEGLILCPLRNVTRGSEPTIPSEHPDVLW